MPNQIFEQTGKIIDFFLFIDSLWTDIKRWQFSNGEAWQDILTTQKFTKIWSLMNSSAFIGFIDSLIS